MKPLAFAEAPEPKADSRPLRRLVGASGLNITTSRWLKRRFKSQAAQNQWCEKHKHELQIVPLFVDNDFVVEFRELKQL